MPPLDAPRKRSPASHAAIDIHILRKCERQEPKAVSGIRSTIANAPPHLGPPQLHAVGALTDLSTSHRYHTFVTVIAPELYTSTSTAGDAIALDWPTIPHGMTFI